MTVALSMALSVALGLLPLVLRSDAPVALRLALALLVAASCAAAARADRWRGPAAGVAVLWPVLAISTATGGPVALVAVGCGLLLRLWCGLPELRAVGRPVARDLALDVAGGLTAAALVVAAADGLPGLPAPTLAAAALGLLALAVLALRRVRT